MNSIMAQINQIESKLNNHRGILFIHKAKPNPNIPTHRYLKINVTPRGNCHLPIFFYTPFNCIQIHMDPYGSHTNKKVQIRIPYIYYICRIRIIWNPYRSHINKKAQIRILYYNQFILLFRYYLGIINLYYYLI